MRNETFTPSPCHPFTPSPCHPLAFYLAPRAVSWARSGFELKRRSIMKISTRIARLRLRHTFTISRGSAGESSVVFVEIEHDGITGLGESAPSAFYGHSAQGVLEALEELAPWLADQSPLKYTRILDEALDRLDGNRAALCALDVALHDWAAKSLGVPLWKMLGLPPAPPPVTSYTIGIDSIAKMAEKLREFDGYPIFKIKLGRDNDIEMVEALRKETRAVFRVDANCAWTADEAIEKSKALARLGVEFIEQPLAPERLEEMERVCRDSALPLIADESAERPEDVAALRGRFDGINVKLVKCGGIAPAMRMLKSAREMGLKTMAGCMIESSLLCTAAAHLGALLDYADLDGPLLIGDDPYQGARYERGTMTLPEANGLGVGPRESR